MIARRAVLFGTITVGVAASAHAAAGGHLPSPVSLAVLAALTAAVGLPMLRRAERRSTLLLGAAAAQVALHPAFERLAAEPAVGMAGHAHQEPPAAMLVAHVVAAVVAAQLVTALDPLLRRVRLPGLDLPTAVTPPTLPRPDPRPASEPSVAVLPWVVATVAPRRGPPSPAPSV